MKKLIWIGVAFLIVLAGCSLVSRDFYFQDKGSLVLIVDDSELPTKTIAPLDPTEMDVAYYEIRGSSTLASESFENLHYTSGVYTENGLTPATDWTLQVEAFNSDDLEIGAIGGVIGTLTPAFEIKVGEVYYANVTVIPIDDDGTLQLDLSWPPGSIDSPSVNATLTPYGAAVNPGTDTIDFTIPAPPADYTASYTDTNRQSGYYLLMLQLLEDGAPAWGYMEAVRVIYGQTSIGDLNLQSAEAGGFYLESLAFYSQDPIEITFDTDPAQTEPWDELSKSGSYAVTAQPVPTDGGNYTYQWYADGASITAALPASSGGNSITLLGNAYSEGEHNFAVLITDPVNETLSSEGFTLNVVVP